MTLDSGHVLSADAFGKLRLEAALLNNPVTAEDFYIRGIAIWRDVELSFEDELSYRSQLREAFESFSEALSKDPHYLVAEAGIAAVTLELGNQRAAFYLASAALKEITDSSVHNTLTEQTILACTEVLHELQHPSIPI